MSKNGNIVSIHQLRGIAALLVVFFHFRFFLNDIYVQKNLGYILFGGGAFGVDLFFMISGFIIAASTRNNSGVFIFCIRRFFRIYPAFIVVFFVGYLTLYSSESTLTILRSFLFIHKDYSMPSPGFGYNLLGPAWTLTYEIYFYFVFSLAMVISHKHRLIISSLFIIIPFMVLQKIYNGEILLTGTGAPNVPIENDFYPLLRFMGSPIIIEFTIGMALYAIYSRFNFKLDKLTSKSILLFAIGLSMAFYFKPNHSGFGMQDFGLWSLLLLSACLLYEKNHAFHESKAISFLGDISFSLYICHYPVIYIFEKNKDILLDGFAGISKFLLLTSVCLILSTILHYCVEKPFIKIGKKIEASIKNGRGLPVGA
ncbi:MULTISPECIES: acyltransferase family protein [Enterobacteriaceae]|jgi:exopolysaccharide production protein ExoZ|uniref:acyltransferase family protein n=1 Tax=Enterobacteriaceae TaxID=543 RepID=UPI00079B4BE7|nr:MULTISPECIES: acyltransferase [Enterobacteriaceae]EEW2031925.1 acyltransferase [Escherichia coli]EEW3746402.1 acyltransferase [Escherichia coli]EFA6875839.1 acyltransferase [Escherichia coli]EFB5130392.1 acyltransferase [Escherichia coli]EFC4989446.1 acyltransferase [Escherichia coli]